MATKNCSKCGENKPLSEFHVRRASKDGLTPLCKPCNIRKVSEYMATRKQEKSEYDKSYRESRWKSHRYVALENVRQTQIRRRGHFIPKWANKFLMQEIYHLRELRQRLIGISVEVDHIVPIASSDLVCGLHCEANLRIIDRKSNRDRWNKTWPDMPE